MRSEFTEPATFDEKGRVIVEPGYHPDSRLFYAPPLGWSLPPLSDKPTKEDIASARDLFLNDVLHASKTSIGVIEGIAESTASILKVFSGWLSDKLGKRKAIIFWGYGISVFSRPLLAGAASWFHVLVYRFTDRVGKGVRTAPRDAIIADSARPEILGKAFGFHRSMDTIGAVIGPTLAFALLARSPRNKTPPPGG